MSAVTIALMFVAMVGLSALELWLFWRLGREPSDPHTDAAELTEAERAPALRR